MTKYNVEFLQLTTLEAFEVKAKNKDEAVKKGFMMLHKYDREGYEFSLINEIDKDGVMIETERVEKVEVDG